MQDGDGLRNTFDGLLHPKEAYQSSSSQFRSVPDMQAQKMEDDLGSDAAVSFDHLSASLVGRSLAVIADEIDDKYSSELSRLVRQFRVISDSFVERFVSLRRRLVSDDAVDWGRAVVMLVFGCRVAVAVLSSGRRPAFVKMTEFVMQLITRENVPRWIVGQVGHVSPSIGPHPTFRTVAGRAVGIVAGLSLAACLLYHFQ